MKLASSFGYATFVKNRLEVFKYLKTKKIQSRPLICGNMGQQPFWKNNVKKNESLPNAEFINKYGLYLPNHANLSFEEIDYICNHFKLSSNPIFFD